jgi:hypothetical protein
MIVNKRSAGEMAKKWKPAFSKAGFHFLCEVCQELVESKQHRPANNS